MSPINRCFDPTHMETDIFDSKIIDQMQRHCATAAIRGRRGADDTSHNLGLPAGGIRRPHALRFAPGVRQRLVVSRHMSPQTPPKRDI